MSNGTFDHFGYNSGGNEADINDVFGMLGSIDGAIAVSFGTDGILSPGDETQLSFTIDGGLFGQIPIVIDGTFIGTDSEGSVHFDFTDFSVAGGSLPQPLEDALVNIINSASDFRITNDPNFPASPFPEAKSVDLPVCFAEGTPIATPHGERAVETLRAGDLVLTADGGVVPVKWMGHQTVHGMFTPAARFCPVRIRAGALGENTPHTDLVVTGDHGILVGGVMVNAAALVNGTTVVRVPAEELADRVTYWHVETEDHSVILAAGAPAETYLDATAREAFDNYGEYVALFGEPEARMSVLPYPRAFGPRQLPARVRAVLAEREADLGLVAAA